MRNKIIYFILFVSIIIIQLQACKNDEGINYQRYYVNGKGLYEKHCQNCHGGDGKGLGRLYPPLTDTTYLIKNKSTLACLIKNGMNKQVIINKVAYDEPMPGNISLADIDVAQVISSWYQNQINTVKYADKGAFGFKGVSVMNFRTGYEWNGIEIFANVINLTNELYASSATRGNNLTDRTTFTPSAPRSITTGIQYNFSAKK